MCDDLLEAHRDLLCRAAPARADGRIFFSRRRDFCFGRFRLLGHRRPRRQPPRPPPALCLIPPPVHHGTLRISGQLPGWNERHGSGPELARGPAAARISLLSFQVASMAELRRASGQHCRAGADATAAPFAARELRPGPGREQPAGLRVTRTPPPKCLQTERVPFNFQGHPACGHRAGRLPGGAALSASPAPATAFVNGVPEKPTRSRPRSTSRSRRRMPTRPTVPSRSRTAFDDGRWAGPAEESRLLHRDAGARPAPGERAHCQPGRCQRDRLLMAGRSR